jgi:DNA repair protein RadB
MKKLQITCKPFDDLVGGGIESGSITEIYGEAGSGKTNLCLQAARECVIAGGKVAFVDSEGVSLERLRQICAHQEYKKILPRIIFFSPISFEEQEKAIKKVTECDDYELIVVDTINNLYRLYLENDDEATNRSLTRQIANLQLSARKHDRFIIVTSQVYTAENGEIKPFAGRGIEHIVKTIIRLDKSGIGKRKATIIKHRSQAEGASAEFSIKAVGLQ